MTSIKAIVTGHTKGLGAALAAQLLSRQIPVLGVARGMSTDLASRFLVGFAQVQVDLGSTSVLQQWLASQQLHDFLHDCDVALLINNAGVVQPVGAMHDQEPADVAMAVSLNVAAPLMLSAAVARAMHGRQSRILHVSSGAGSSAYPGWSVYCATKAALDHHARAAALDATAGVRICSLAPGVIDTGMQAEIRATPAERFPMKERFVEMKKDGALVAPDECARRVVEYLLADAFGREAVDDLRNGA
jgi:benzil reductase ((S)-benzoin forming)